MKISFKINALEIVRYVVTYQDNAILIPSSISVPHENEMDITYEQLIKKHQERLTPISHGTHSGPHESQAFRNSRSTLNSYLIFIGKSLANRVGAEFHEKSESIVLDVF